MLGLMDEMGHYFIIVGYLHFLQKSISHPASILDVGCGNGKLYEYVRNGFPESQYTGIDLSSAAIDICKKISQGSGDFIAADFNGFNSIEKFDAIIFNESIYYSANPADTILRYKNMLAKNGKIILSVFDYANHAKIISNISRIANCEHSTTVINNERQRWDVFLLS
jgi:2-polyprenyl-3-methyl-5-hydroxy-6-metoxy-1,4-benzoquinol methylase